MASAINHKKRSHRSHKGHMQAAAHMKGSAPRRLGLYTGRSGLGIMRALARLGKAHRARRREAKGKNEEQTKHERERRRSDECVSL